jgi:protein-disulfide isomerase
MHKGWLPQTLIFVVSFATMNCIGYAQCSEYDCKKEVEEIKQSQQAIRKELMEIKSLLSGKSAPNTPQVNVKDMIFEIGNSPIRGSNNATLTIVEFTDYQCPFCGRHVRETFPKILEQYISKGLIRYAVLDQPLSMHKMAAKAAEASHCADEQGKFWEYHNLTMSKQEWIEDLNSYAISLKLNTDQFDDCLRTNKYVGKIEKDISLAMKLGVNGVPGFILALSDPQHPTKMKGISFIRGAQPFSIFQKEIELALTNQQASALSK